MQVSNWNSINKTPTSEEIEYPFRVVITNLPTNYSIFDFENFILGTLKFAVPKIIGQDNSPVVSILFKDRTKMEIIAHQLGNIVWNMKRLVTNTVSLEDKKRKRADSNSHGGDMKKVKNGDFSMEVTVQDVALAEELPFFAIPYEEQSILTIHDATLMATNFHAALCIKNPGLAGWAEKSCEMNGGTIYQIDPPVMADGDQMGYRSKFLFEVGLSKEGEIVVGVKAVLANKETYVVGVEPGDSFIHLPYSMKYVAKVYQNFIRSLPSAKIDKQSTVASWQKVRVMTTLDDGVMVITGVCGKSLTVIDHLEGKKAVEDYFTPQLLRDANITSLHFHITKRKRLLVYHAEDEMIHIAGKATLQEQVGGLMHVISPFSARRTTPKLMDKQIECVVRLAQATPDMIAISICGWHNSIPFALHDKCLKTYIIEGHRLSSTDVERTKILNGLRNVEVILGEYENAFGDLMKKLNKNQPVIILIGVLPNGITPKLASLIREHPKVVRIIGVAAEMRKGVRCWSDELAVAEGMDPATDFNHKGHPFLPVRAVPIDSDPFTGENTILVVSERVDPSRYPPPTKPTPPLLAPIPVPLGVRQKQKPRPSLKVHLDTVAAEAAEAAGKAAVTRAARGRPPQGNPPPLFASFRKGGVMDSGAHATRFYEEPRQYPDFASSRTQPASRPQPPFAAFRPSAPMARADVCPRPLFAAPRPSALMARADVCPRPLFAAPRPSAPMARADVGPRPLFAASRSPAPGVSVAAGPRPLFAPRKKPGMEGKSNPPSLMSAGSWNVNPPKPPSRSKPRPLMDPDYDVGRAPPMDEAAMRELELLRSAKEKYELRIAELEQKTLQGGGYGYADGSTGYGMGYEDMDTYGEEFDSSNGGAYYGGHRPRRGAVRGGYGQKKIPNLSQLMETEVFGDATVSVNPYAHFGGYTGGYRAPGRYRGGYKGCGYGDITYEAAGFGGNNFEDVEFGGNTFEDVGFRYEPFGMGGNSYGAGGFGRGPGGIGRGGSSRGRGWGGW